MEEYQIRVVEEKKDLDNKLMRLIEFMETGGFMSLSLDERGMMARQEMAMVAYSDVLSERIDAFDI